MKMLIAVLACLGLALPMTACAQSLASTATLAPAVPPAMVVHLDSAQPILPIPEPAPVAAALPKDAPMTPAAWASAPATIGGASLPPFTTAQAALVLDEASAQVLYHKEGHTPLPPASLTKIVTAVVAIEKGNLDEWVTVQVDSRKMVGSTVMGLRAGEQFTLRDLVYGLMLPSGNDAALAIARHISGSDMAFVAEMNALMKRLGLHESHFTNPHGLNAPGHVISPYDLAMLARYAMTLPAFREVVATPKYEAHGTRILKMGSMISGMLAWIDGADGVKSGFTEQAGKTLVFSAMRNGHRVFVVTMNSRMLEGETAELTEWAFGNFDWNPRAAPAHVAMPQPAPDPGGSSMIQAAMSTTAH
jgi:D-alanyl-D-alanine carboxypeptidase (penicillin-binding protein 5/6)